MSILKFESVHKGYGETPVLKDINLEVLEGEFLVLLGFSGTGKTTLINLMAGLEQPSKGAVTFKGAPIIGPGPERGVIFQSYSLMPWLTVNGNVRLAVDTVFPGMSADEKQAKVDHYVKMVGLSHAINRRPAELSGGMRQRVNVARALAMKPEVLLLDEPSAGLSPIFVDTLFSSIAETRKEKGLTIVLAEQNAVKTLEIADRVMVLSLGEMHLLRPRSELEMSDITAAYHI